MSTRRQKGVTVREALIEAIGVAEENITPEHEARMARVLQATGMRPVKRAFRGIQTTFWVDTPGGYRRGERRG
jgi:hypothetical protein